MRVRAPACRFAHAATDWMATAFLLTQIFRDTLGTDDASRPTTSFGAARSPSLAVIAFRHCVAERRCMIGFREGARRGGRGEKSIQEAGDEGDVRRTQSRCKRNRVYNHRCPRHR